MSFLRTRLKARMVAASSFGAEPLEARVLFTVGSPYTVPTNPESSISEDASWKFQLNPSGTPQSTSYSDSSWGAVTLPHTWDANSNSTGIGWYRKTITIASNLLNGPDLYLQFAGADSVTSLYIDGTQIDYDPNTSGVQAHGGGFSAFAFDVTSALNAAIPQGLSGHLIAVAVNNNSTAGVNGTNDSSVSPAGGGDYVHQGGLYRDVSLIATNKTHIALIEKDPSTDHTNVATEGPGVYFATTSTVVIGSASANIAVTAVLDNQNSFSQNVNVTSYLVDANGVIQSQVTTPITIPALQTTVTAATPVVIEQTSTVANPHLWDGRVNPYLYALYVEVRDSSNNLLDLYHQQAGIRSFAFNAQPTASQSPFTLDGQPYALVGADIHQDSGVPDSSGNPVGWAQTAAEIQADVALGVNLGVTVFRTSHYEESQAFYTACDQAGILVWTEDGVNGTLGNPGSAELYNTEDQLTELVKQTYDHASVFAFGLANETDGASAASFTTLNILAHGLDQLTQYDSNIPQTHQTSIASDGGDVQAATMVPDIKGTHRYDYWYGPSYQSVTATHNADPTQPLGITEMGGGGSAYQYVDGTISLPVTNVTTNYHPQNQQTLIEETQWTDLTSASFNYLWGKIVWQMFDMIDYKTEGDQDGLNDKGLVTRYRVKKDAYYFYQAQWNVPTRNYDNLKVIHIADQYWTVRNRNTPTVTVYSNIGAPTLFLNGVSLGTMTPLQVTGSGSMAGTSSSVETVPDVYTITLTAADALAVGKNNLIASVVYSGDGQTYSDSSTWQYDSAAAFAADTPVRTGISVNTNFNYDPIHQTTSNPFTVSSLPNGVYDVRIISPSGGVNNLSLNGQTAAIDTNGLSTADTFYDRVAVTNGTLTLAAAPGAFNAAVTSMDISLVTGAPTVNSVTINGGAAQRTNITSLSVQFSDAVTLQSNAITLNLKNVNGVGYAATYSILTSNPSGDNTNFSLSLSSGASLTTLPVGTYDLVVDSTKVTDLYGLGMTSPYTDTFNSSLISMQVGTAFSVPANPETSTPLNTGWKFALNPTGSPATVGFNDSSWTGVSLPHTWDPNSTNVQTGDGWYRQTITIPTSMIGQEIYLQFLGASISATVYVDGVQVGTHNGGWEAFDIDVTSQMTAGSHLIAVDVNNNTNSNVVPAGGGDYTKQGGLYRTVSLLGVSKSHVALTEPMITPDTSGSLLAGSGVYFSNSAVSMGIASTNIQVETVLDNLSASSAPVTVTSYLVDSGGIIQAEQISSIVLAANQKDAGLYQSAVVYNPHLWNGLADPYLYDLYVLVTSTASGQVIDLNHQQVGIRSFNVNANTGFTLNGRSYKLVGVDMHQDSGVTSANGGVAGWAQTDAQQQADIDMALAMGVTMIRTSHYQRDPTFYSYCDSKGLIVETEFGLNDTVTSTTTGSAFVNNAEDQLTELIRQNYNHPSILFWSLYNEIPSSTANGAFINVLGTLAHTLDQTGRMTLGETDSGAPTDGINSLPDALNYHPYNGWYSGNPTDIASSLAADHAASSKPIGVGEFGAGGSAYQFTTNITIPIASTTSVYHPENEQTAIIEEQYAAISSQSYLFDTLVWDMFDFSSSGRSEGDTQGINDKGLVTRDRSVYKDAYYFYQATWNSPASTRGYDTTPVVWISDHQWTDRQGSPTVTVTVFSNLGAPALTLNGGTAVTMTPQVLGGLAIPDAYTATIVLAAGSNSIQASATFNGQAYSNNVIWIYHAAALSGTPYANVEYTNSASNLQTGYSADTGQPFGVQSNGATYGWTNAAGTPLANTSGTYYRTGNTSAPYGSLSAQTGIILNPGNVWQYQLPNGAYDLDVVGADSATSSIVDNLSINGSTLHATSFSTAGGTYQEFYCTVTVTNGLLSITGGPGMVLSNGGTPLTQGRLSSIEINSVSSPSSTVVGTTGNNSIVLAGKGSMIQVSVNGVATQTNPYSAMTPVILSGEGGTDTLALNFPSGSSPALNVSSGNFNLTVPTNTVGIQAISLASLILGNGVSVTIAPANTQSDRSVLVVGSLMFSGTGSSLTLGVNDLIIQNLPPAQTLASLIESNPFGSPPLQSAQASLLTYGISQNSSLFSFDNQPVSIGETLVKCTYVGDATLDGKVDGSDYGRIDNGFLTHASGWANGDFNYDGVVDGSDYTLIDNAFNTQGASLKASVAALYTSGLAANSSFRASYAPQIVSATQNSPEFPSNKNQNRSEVIQTHPEPRNPSVAKTPTGNGSKLPSGLMHHSAFARRQSSLVPLNTDLLGSISLKQNTIAFNDIE